METRKQLSKKIRFEVFKRDGFTCQYCGSTPPNSVLECDHINPVSKGGTNELYNLITACFDCNRGKSNNKLEKIALSVSEKHNILIEKDLQFKEYQKLVRRLEKKLRKQEDEVSGIYNDWFPEYELGKRFKQATVRKFIDSIGIIETKKSMNTACSRVNNSSDSIKYFCGICWNIIKGNTY